MTTIVNEKDLDYYKFLFENEIKQKLKIENICKAIQKNGNKYNSCATEDRKTFKKHEKSTKLVKQKKEIIYHNHLPFEKDNNCPLCVK
jgi:hypothetical protein